MPASVAKLYDEFLAPNGIVGWMPEQPTVVVANGRLTAPLWRHRSGDGPWGRNVLIKSDLDRSLYASPNDGPVIDPLTVPLVVPVTDRVRKLARASGLRLVEQ